MRQLPFILLLLGILACNLSSGEEAAEPTALPLIVATQSPAPTQARTPTPTIALTATPNTNINTGQQPAALPPTVSNCVPRADWTATYTVKAGDTLGSIAQTVGSTVNDVSRANCLANPNSIAVGLQLRVPRAATGNNTTGNNTTGNNTTGNNTTGNNTTGNNTTGNNTTGNKAPQFTASLTITPTTNQTGIGLVAYQQTVALDIGVVSDADRVDFYAGLTLDDANPVLIGTDNDPFDGTRISYDFNEFDERLFFSAVATNEFGSTKTMPVSVVYDPAAAATPLTITPYIGFDGNFYTLQHGASVSLIWANPPQGAQRVDFYLVPTGTGATGTLIASDTNLADGASTIWVVPEWILAHISAQAFSGNTAVGISEIGVYSEGAGVRPSN